MNKLIVHGCGGAGINITFNVLKDVKDLSKSYLDMELNYLDTSLSNIKLININHPDEINDKNFWLVKKTGFSGNDVDGSGSERSVNAGLIKTSIMGYLDKLGYDKKVTGEYHLCIASGSGGTGNVIQFMLSRSLIERGIPVILLVVGDTSNGLFAKNTKKVLDTLQNFAVDKKLPINVIYFNNKNHNLPANEAEKKTNTMIFNSVSTLTAFLSDTINGIDNQDMLNIISQNNYISIDIKPGLYGLASFSKEVVIPENTNPIVGRTITTIGGEQDINIPLQHSKTGYMVNEDMISIFGDQTPIHLVTFANLLTTERKVIKKTIEDFDKILNEVEVENDEIDGVVDDDTGMVF